MLSSNLLPEKPRNLADALLCLVDVLVAAMVCVLPFIMGGREAWGHWFLISTAFLLGAAWCAYAAISAARYSFSWLEYFLLAAIGVAWFQIQPQSSTRLEGYSPEYTRLLNFWPQTQPTDSAWSTLSLTPIETQHGFWMMIAYTIFAIVIFQRLRTTTDCARLVKWIAITGVAMTCFGLFQWANSNGNFYWVYKHPYTDTKVHLKGAFTNRNHFAQFLALSLGPLLWWLMSELKPLLQSATPSEQSSSTGRMSRRRELPPVKQPLSLTNHNLVPLSLAVVITAACLVGFGVVLSLSRGGMIAAAAIVIISLVGLWRGVRLGGTGILVAVGGTLMFLSLLSFTDQEELQTKVDQVLSSDADQMDMGGVRRAIWAADAKVIRKFPLFGTGVGSHRYVYPLYMDNFDEHAMAEMTHAESSFVNIALETGLIGSGLLIAALLFVLVRLVIGYFRCDESNRMFVAVVVACVFGGILHGIVDFIWYAPAIVVTSLSLLAVGLRTASDRFTFQQSQGGLWFPRLGWAAIGGFCLLGLVSQQPTLFARIDGERHWFAALNTHREDFEPEDEYDQLGIGDELELETVDPLAEPEPVDEEKLIADRIATEKAFLATRIRHLKKSIAARPDEHRVKWELARSCLLLFDILQMDGAEAFSLRDFRDAAATGFDSGDELVAWLRSNVGDEKLKLLKLANHLASKALRECPVEGRAYLNLMETAFLNPNAGPNQKALLQQALLVRGNDPNIRLAAGQEALMEGNFEVALEYLSSVFHSTQAFRHQVIRLYVMRAPAQWFVKQFEPSGEELEDLLLFSDALERDADSQVILKRLVEVVPQEAPSIEDEDERLAVMLRCFNAAHRLEDFPAAVVVLKQTIEQFPYEFEPRYFMGRTLLEMERPDDAMTHLSWCYEQQPGHIHLQYHITAAQKLRLKIEEEGGPAAPAFASPGVVPASGTNQAATLRSRSIQQL